METKLYVKIIEGDNKHGQKIIKNAYIVWTFFVVL